MKIIHVSHFNDTGYDVATLIANKTSPNNRLAVIEVNDEIIHTSGIIVPYSEDIDTKLSNLSFDEQVLFMKSINLETPFVKEFYEDVLEEPSVDKNAGKYLFTVKYMNDTDDEVFTDTIRADYKDEAAAKYYQLYPTKRIKLLVRASTGF